MSKIIVIIGAPGAGKGTQSRLLSEKYGYPQISTGDILRGMARADTPLGLKVRETMAAGRLVSDEILAEVIRERTSQSDCANGYILDGYPRTLNQANQLEELASKQGKQILLARIDVSEDVLFKRMTGRRACPVCGEIYNIYFRPPKVDGVCDLDGAALTQRSDDNPESVIRRLEEYKQSTAPLIDYYRQSGRLIELDGEAPVNEVFDKLLAAIEGPNN
ncbi:MAG TPA: adenylate kinase [Blastocatellia bacterium]|jgi:adenylate kinase|nr:adenylate kinase [Blastocatellia bacterium]